MRAGVEGGGEKPAKRRHHQTEMLKVRSLKDGALNRGAGAAIKTTCVEEKSLPTAAGQRRPLPEGRH